MYTPDEWAPSPAEPPHDHKGHSEEKCVRCGWVMGHRPLNCMNDDTPHVFPSQQTEIDQLRGWHSEMFQYAADRDAEIERLRAEVDAIDAQVAAYMNDSIGSSAAIQAISRLLHPVGAQP
jgi:hypothetical protein